LYISEIFPEERISAPLEGGASIRSRAERYSERDNLRTTKEEKQVSNLDTPLAQSGREKGETGKMA